MTVVRAQTDGTRAVPGGPVPESKEFLAGYWIIDVGSPERAYEIAARLSALPGPGGRAREHPDRGPSGNDSSRRHVMY
jgi:hypothetical protein